MKDKVLDKFLFDCKQSANRRHNKGNFQPGNKQGIALLQKRPLSSYANPSNWFPTGTVEFYLKDDRGVEHTVCYCSEERHKLSDSARRYSPCCPLPGLPAARRVLVSGPHWIMPWVQPRRLDTESEVKALTERFYELIGETNYSGVV